MIYITPSALPSSSGIILNMQEEELIEKITKAAEESNRMQQELVDTSKDVEFDWGTRDVSN